MLKHKHAGIEISFAIIISAVCILSLSTYEKTTGPDDRAPVLFIRWFHWDTNNVMIHTWINEPKVIMHRNGPYWFAKWNPLRRNEFGVLQGLRPNTRLLIVELDTASLDIISATTLLRGSAKGFPFYYSWNPKLPLLAIEFWYPADTNKNRYMDDIIYLPDIAVYNYQTRKLVFILGHPRIVEYQPAWHPGGKLLAFISGIGSPSDTFNREEPVFNIFIAPLDSPEHARQLTYHGKAHKYLVWTPDGKAILYYSMGRKEGMGMYWLEPDNGIDTLFLPEGYAPSWSPSGRYVIFRKESDPPGLWVKDMVTGTCWRLTDKRDNYPSWAK